MFRSVTHLFFIFFLLLNVHIVHANVFLGLGGGVRLIKSDDSNFEGKFTPMLYGGYKILPWAFALEALYYDDESDAGTSYTIENKHYEASIYALRFINYEEGKAINPYVLGGWGLFQERLTSNFMGAVDKDKSKLNSAVKIGLGAWAPLGSLAFINLEAKGMYSKDFTPDLIFELSSKVGVDF